MPLTLRKLNHPAFQASLLKKRRGVAIAITYRSVSPIEIKLNYRLVSHRPKLSFSFNKYFLSPFPFQVKGAARRIGGSTSLHLVLSFRAQRRIPAFLTTSICWAPTLFQSPAAKIEPPRLSGTPP
ncbi:hypothetical protein EV200_11342 [Pedobacter psychrotolerans]|uniref:Uncharacterized protein n=1 Tax=Pedobacter psychrotolerans TaxID=1843235 RepID=A0A4V2RY61_9SPHI|nr:hypothetical protein EV200_11342 [Pedobacter psychrotolerans]